ncbi:MAG: hypothetical protein E7Y34_01050 [Mycoplasma sp.]|nr:hypothetical protein [Mycoplasma sp.]
MIDRKKYFMTLLFLFLKIKDTTILKKISLSKYRKAKQYIKKQFLSIEKDYSWKKIYKLNNWALENNISPGGCADLLVIAIFFDLLLKNKMLL